MNNNFNFLWHSRTGLSWVNKLWKKQPTLDMDVYKLMFMTTSNSLYNVIDSFKFNNLIRHIEICRLLGDENAKHSITSILALSHFEIIFHNNWHLKYLSGLFWIKSPLQHFIIIFLNEMHCIPNAESKATVSPNILLLFLSIIKKSFMSKIRR